MFAKTSTFSRSNKQERAATKLPFTEVYLYPRANEKNKIDILAPPIIPIQPKKQKRKSCNQIWQSLLYLYKWDNQQWFRQKNGVN